MNVRPPLEYTMPILVVDDHQTMIDITTRVLWKIGFNIVDQALDGAEALRMLRERRYGLVISDLHMGAFDGFRLLNAARSEESLRDTRFLMVTADYKAANVTLAKKLGADAYLLKPFSPAQMRMKVFEVLSGSRREPDLRPAIRA